jgi:hypothetical protein
MTAGFKKVEDEQKIFFPAGTNTERNRAIGDRVIGKPPHASRRPIEGCPT